MTENELHELLQKYHVPHHILAHMEKVAKVAAKIGKALQKKGIKVNLEVLRQGAMLHDIAKVCDFKELDLSMFTGTYTAEDVQFWQMLIKTGGKDGHVKAGFNILRDLGEEELALIIKKHGYNSLIAENPGDRPQTWEEKIIYYSDKRVKHDKVVSVEERLKDGRQRYFPDGNVPTTDALVQKALLKLETEIMKAAGLKPEDLSDATV